MTTPDPTPPYSTRPPARLPRLTELDAAKVEAMARAIAEATMEGPSWEWLGQLHQEDYRVQALAALRAEEAHAEGHIWQEVTPADGVGPSHLECVDCGETGWVE